MARPKTNKSVVTDDFSKTSANPQPTAEETVNVDGIDIPVSELTIEPEAILKESEITEEMKQEVPVNTPETAIPVVSFSVENATVKTTEPKLKVNPDCIPDYDFGCRINACADHFNQEFFEAAAKSGCDYKSLGDWQKAYAGLMLRAFALAGKKVLDVGSAFGALGFAMKQCGADVTCVDISEHVIDTKLFDVAYTRAPAQDMGVIDQRQDFIHASYLLNSVDPLDLDAVFVEFAKHLNPNGKVFIIMNFGKGQKVADFDIRHSKEAIIAAAANAGLKEVANVVSTLRNVDDARYQFMSQYNWGIVCFE